MVGDVEPLEDLALAQRGLGALAEGASPDRSGYELRLAAARAARDRRTFAERRGMLAAARRNGEELAEAWERRYEATRRRHAPDRVALNRALDDTRAAWEAAYARRPYGPCERAEILALA